MKTIEKQAEGIGLFNQNSYWYKAFLILIIIFAVLIRFDERKAPGHLLDREYTSAIFARAFYFENNASIEPWRQEVAASVMNHQPTLEPPLTDLLVSWIYRLLGREEIWYARILTNAFWLIGGIFLYLLARILLPHDAALFATGYYLFVPMGVEISRSFQPDALMMMMFMISLYSMIRYFQLPSWKWLILTGSITGLAILLRPLVVFVLLFAFLAMSIYTKGNWLRVIDKRFVVFCILAVTPGLAYYGYGIVIADYMNWKVAHSFRPYLFLKIAFWQGWFDLAAYVSGQAFLLLAIAGFSLLQKSLMKSLVIGLAVGYFIFGLVFTYHTHTHHYYHIQLIPIVGICASMVIRPINRWVKKSQNKGLAAVTVVMILLTIYFSYREVRNSLYQVVSEDPAIAQEVGNIVKHSSRTVFVSYHYGIPLQYFGEFTGSPWPVAIEDPFYRFPGEKERTVQERIDALGFNPEYFVITNMNLYERKHQDLGVYLNENCMLEAETDAYLVYSTCQNLAKK